MLSEMKIKKEIDENINRLYCDTNKFHDKSYLKKVHNNIREVFNEYKKNQPMRDEKELINKSSIEVFEERKGKGEFHNTKI